MPKGYWIAHIDVTDAENYLQYMALSTAAIRAFGGIPIVRGGPAEVMEGAMRGRHIVVEFPSIEIARECYQSEQYQEAKALRNAYADSDLVIVEGAS